MSGTTRVVAYRNCGGSLIGARAIFNGTPVPNCIAVPAGQGAILATYANGLNVSWSTQICW